MTDRFGIIGASEVAGLLKEYSANLLAENIINNETFDKLQDLPSYLETRYSLAKKLMLGREQFKRFNEFNTNKAMLRGKEMESAVKDHYLLNYAELKVVEEQTEKEFKLNGWQFNFRATIDFLLSNNELLEVKTTSINSWAFNAEKNGGNPALPFNYYIQAQAQMWMHKKEKNNVYIAALDAANNIVDSERFICPLDRDIIKAINASLTWFNYEFNKGVLLDKEQEQKTKKDKQIDEFLEIEKGTLRLPLDNDLSSKLARLKELENFKKEYDAIDKELKTLVRNKMDGYAMASFKSNQFQIEAKYSKESYYDETSIEEAINKAKSINVGDVKASKKLTIKY